MGRMILGIDIDIVRYVESRGYGKGKMWKEGLGYGMDGERWGKDEGLDGQEMGWWGGMWVMIVKNGKKV